MPCVCARKGTAPECVVFTVPVQRRAHENIEAAENRHGMAASIENFSVDGDGYDLPGDQPAAFTQCVLQRELQPAAAGNLHPHERDAFDLVLAQNLTELFAVVHTVELRAADQRDFPRMNSSCSRA